jgi:hypothetical protein
MTQALAPKTIKSFATWGELQDTGDSFKRWIKRYSRKGPQFV